MRGFAILAHTFVPLSLVLGITGNDMEFHPLLGFFWIAGVIFFLTNSWRFSKDISKFVNEFRAQRKNGLRFSMCGAGLKRRGKLTTWDGLGQVATDKHGVYYSSLCLPRLFLPWHRISFVGLNNSRYSILKISGFPTYTVLIPKRIRLEERAN